MDDVRPIDANALIKKLQIYYESLSPDVYSEFIRRDEVSSCIAALMDAPTVDAESVKTCGVHSATLMHVMTAEEKAEISSMPIFNNKCGNCGAMCFDDDTYCSECGAYFEKNERKEKTG